VTDPGCAFDSGDGSSDDDDDAASRGSSHGSGSGGSDSGAGGGATRCCDRRLCHTGSVSVVSELVERRQTGLAGGLFNDAASSLLSPVDQLSAAAFESDSEPSYSPTIHIQRELILLLIILIVIATDCRSFT